MALTINTIAVPALDSDPTFVTISGRLERKVLALSNKSDSPSDVFWSFEPPATAGVENDTSGTFKGVPLAAGQTVILGGAQVDVGGPLYLTCPSGGSATVYYTDKV